MTAPTTQPLVVASPDEVGEVEFDKKMETVIKKILGRYPDSDAALLPVLWLCQEKWGWISPGIMRAIGDRLELSPAFIEGVVSFYTMYQRRPPGRPCNQWPLPGQKHRQAGCLLLVAHRKTRCVPGRSAHLTE